MTYFLYSLSVFLACGVLETADHFFCGSKKMRRQANRSVSTDRQSGAFADFFV